MISTIKRTKSNFVCNIYPTLEQLIKRKLYCVLDTD